MCVLGGACCFILMFVCNQNMLHSVYFFSKMTSLNSKLNGDITSACDSLLRLLNDCDVKDSPWCQVRHVHICLQTLNPDIFYSIPVN